MIDRECPLTPSSTLSNDEISLIDLWRTLVCHKKMILLVFIVILLVAVGYLLLADPVYESKVVVRVGQVGKYVEDVSGIKQRLIAEYPMLTSVETGKPGATNIFTLTFQTNDRVQAEEQLKSITEKFIGDHRILFTKAIAPIQQRIEALQGQLIETQNQISELNTQIELFKVNEPAQASMLVMEKNNLSLALSIIEEKVADLKQSIVEPYSLPTQLLGVQTTPEEPIRPNKKLVIALAVLLGLILGVFAAFFSEFVSYAREGKAIGKEK